MREYVIQNVDSIQLLVNPGDERVYFPVSTHLHGKKILYLESYYVFSSVTYDLTGRYPLLSSSGIYVTLYDMEGNLIVDSLTINYFNSFAGNDLPKINREIDWERSFLTIRGDIPVKSVIYFSVYIGTEGLPSSLQKNVYNLPVTISSPFEDISLYRRAQALEGKKINGLYISSLLPGDKQDYPSYEESGYIYLVPKDKSRFLNGIPLSFLSGVEAIMAFGPVSLRRKFIDPVEIDFNRSFIYIRSTNRSTRNLNLTFTYE